MSDLTSLACLGSKSSLLNDEGQILDGCVSAEGSEAAVGQCHDTSMRLRLAIDTFQCKS
jgi:hypothetical protein